ncbi:unnamed protein product [Paramecium sonneborni]|uniref:Origin recognition complex subunit 4 n=1 Tax=Paramecium sonneborni TaxID=65129 RepID=A0A8S1QRP9_9CILI|nr:unnamed protein product [Paramecium sonneborni]
MQNFMFNQYMSQDLIDSYPQFSQYFSEDVINNVLIDESDKIRELTDRLKDSLKSKTNNTILLYGQEGFGRKSAIRKAIDNCEQELQMKSKKIIKIFVNAYLHKSEGNILSAINNQLLQIAQIKSKINKLSVDELMKHFKQYENIFHGIVLVIDRVEILATVKKQFFLYSILEWIRESKYPIIFVGITSDLLFQEKLEKRVKSRFQNIPYFFMDLDFLFIQKLLLARLEQIDRNQVINIYENYIQSKSFEDFFAKLQSLQISISKLIFLFRSSFFLAGSRFTKPDKKIEDIIKFERNTQAQPISLQELMEQSLKWIYPNVKLENGKLLSQPEYVILFTLYNLIMQQKPQIMFDDIIQQTKKAMQIYKLQHHKNSSDFTPLVLNKALDNLIKQKFISLQQQSKNLENNQIILCMSLDDLKNLFENLKQDLPGFMIFLFNFNF